MERPDELTYILEQIVGEDLARIPRLLTQIKAFDGNDLSAG